VSLIYNPTAREDFHHFPYPFSNHIHAMVIVAVVGGTGSVGKTIVEALKADGHHEVIVIGRKVDIA
jgi:NADPH:quinone reductase-like Zn-dependent oxidoreductase